MKKIILFCFLIVNLGLNAQTLFQFDNMNFEKGFENNVPVSWQFPSKFIKNGSEAKLNTQKVLDGAFSVKLFNNFANNTEIVEAEKYSNLFQSIDAIPYRNKIVRFTINILNDSLPEGSFVSVWIQTRALKDSVEISEIATDSMQSNKWKTLTVEAIVDRNINEIRYGIRLSGNGKVYADKAIFEVVQPEGYSFERANPINDIYINNLVSVAKLYGYVRYFYPGLEAQLVDWERFLYNIIYLAEDKKEDDFLNDLNKHFKQVAPAIHIYKKDSKFKPNYEKPKEALKDAALAYRHSGCWSQRNNSMYFTEIRDVFIPVRIREAAVLQVIDVSKYRGQKITFSADIKVNSIGAAGNAQIWMRGDDAANNSLFTLTTEDNQARNKNWKKYELSAKIGDEVKNVRLGLVFFGEGKANFDNCTLTVTNKNGKVEKINVRNGNFEEDEIGRLTRGWVVPASVLTAGYETNVVKESITSNNKIFEISSDTTTIEYFPEINEIYTNQISNNLNVSFPMVIYYDSSGTYPKGDGFYDFSNSLKPKGYYPNPKDRSSRMIQTIQLWSVINHFSINTKNVNFDSVLINSLKKAAIDPDWNSFRNTLKSVISNLGDAQAKIWSADSTIEYGIPYLFEMIENRLIITGIPDTNSRILPGDEVIFINDKNVQEVITEITRLDNSPNELYKIRKAIAEIRAGNKFSTLKLKIKSEKYGIIDTTLQKDVLLNEITEPRPPAFSKFEKEIYYLDLTSIDDTRFVDFLKNIPEAKKFIFDLRGPTQMSEQFLGFFLDENINSIDFRIPIYTKPDKKLINYKMVNGVIEALSKYSGANIVFLSDERSVGYSEVILAVVKEHSLGTIVGRETAGTAGEATVVRLSGNIGISLTGMEMIDAKGNSLFGKTIKPDVIINQKIEDLKKFNDPILEAAFVILEK